MRKFGYYFLLILIVVFSTGCGKKEEGKITIENKSSYKVVYAIGQDYSESEYTIQPSITQNIHWKQYRLFWIENPKNVLTWEEKGDKIVIKDLFSEKNKPYKYIFKTNFDSINLNNYYFINQNGIEKKINVDVLLEDAAKNFKLKNTAIDLQKNKDKEIYCARKLRVEDICIDRGTLLTIAATASASGKEEKRYTFTRNEKGECYFNKIAGSSPTQSFASHQIRVEIKHTATCGYVEIKAPDTL